MKKHLLKFLFTISSFVMMQNSFAQCPGCVINPACSDATPGTRFPNLCPTRLPDGTMGVPYSEDLTIWIPQTFTYSGVAVTITHIDVRSVSGLPAGLSVETSLGALPVGFGVTGDMRVCAKVCGTPTIPGARTININVHIQVSTPVGPQESDAAFPIPITINPPAGGNPFFSFTSLSGCDSVTNNFDALIVNPPYPVDYDWDFNNDGTVDFSGKTPPTQVFNTVGPHYVSLATTLYNFRVTRIAVNNIRQATWYWHEFCGDGTGVTIFGAPLYTHISDADFTCTLTDGSNVYNGPEQTDNDGPTWNFVMPYNPTPGVLTVSFREVDPGICGGGQNGGIASVSAPGAGSFAFSTIGGDGPVTGNITVERYIDTVFRYTDTIWVYPSPDAPVVLASADTFCEGDSVNLYIGTSTTGMNIEWYRDSSFLADYTDSSIWVNSPGVYRVKITNSNGCFKTSDGKTITRMASPPNLIAILLIPGRQLVNSNFPGPGFSIQWYKDGILIPGATGQFLNLGDGGNYTARVYNTNFPDCSRESGPFEFSTVGITEVNQTMTKPQIYPNPAHGDFTLEMELKESQNIKVSIINAIGQNILAQNWNSVSGIFKKQISVAELSGGVYTLRVESGSNVYSQKLIIE